ncbi:N-glycosylation protein-domain-containing protein [Echria macrotheca]|uniref:N-glycosylation protein-domain-containing protein n=1 Tax=Echria macrotheca TaxID=438768 RepID=A0AAJ0BHJ6_9PEZI|nr:N-glycosylation protein-domain-containing protein [Echria macrotheca]
MSNRARTPAQRRTADNPNNNSTGNLHNPPPANGSSSRRSNSKHHHSLSSNSHADEFLPETAGSRPGKITAPSSLLQPRVAVVLGLSKTWHPLLFVCRLLSIGPAVWWGLPSGLRLLVMLHLLLFDRAAGGVKGGGAPGSNTETPPTTTASACDLGGGGGGGPYGTDMPTEARLRLYETLLATIWCGASGYLSFFFTDCLMSRWLLNYTPQATLVRLVAISATNAYLTTCALWVTGASADPRLLLPAWIAISMTLTAMYHVTQRKINIRKETSISINVISIASFVSMVVLLVHVHSNRSDYPDIPLVALVRLVWRKVVRLVLVISNYGYGNEGIL